MRPSLRLAAATALAFHLALPATTSTATATTATVSCADFGLGDATLQDGFCDELNALLTAPFSGDNGSERSATSPRQEIQRLLERDALLFEAFRSQPQRTLDLIRRIQDAGGLKD